jgi:hypothetical protein
VQPLKHNPGAVGIGSEVAANGVRGLAGATTAGAAVSVLGPAGSEEVSLQAALAFAMEGAQTLAVNAMAQQELSHAGLAYVEASGVYASADESGAAVLS